MGFSTFNRSVIKTFTAKRKPEKMIKFMLSHYPRVYKFIFDSLSRKQCPLCGFQLKASYAFGSHIKSPKCKEAFYQLARMMQGSNYTEEDLFNYINNIRRQHGLPPVNPDNY